MSVIGWKSCRNCGERGWLQNTCAKCLDRLSEKILGEPRGERHKCFIHWCEWDANKSGYCSHHEDNPDETELLHEMTVAEACLHYDISKAVIYEWAAQGQEGIRKTPQGWAVTPMDWMDEYVDAIKNWEEV